MTILCIGKSGQVAKALAERAGTHEQKLVCLGRPEFDLLKIEDIQAAIDREEPGFVVNAAAYTKVDGAESDSDAAFALNAAAPRNLAQICAMVSIPLLHISTDYVFDGKASRPYREDDPTQPLSVYGQSKRDGEMAIAAALENHIILRTSWVYGPHNSNFVTTMLRLAKERGGASVVDDQIGAPTSALDIADAILTIAKQVLGSPKPVHWGTFHFTAAGACSWADFAELIFDTYDQEHGSSTSLKRIPTSEYTTPATRPMNSCLSTDKISDVYGIQPRDWDVAVRESVARLLRTAILPS